MQQYIKDRLKSRGLTEYDHLICEVCGKANVVDVHHINSSHRGKRKHKKDATDLIGVCRSCHEKIHANNTFEKRQFCLAIAKKKVILEKNKGGG